MSGRYRGVSSYYKKAVGCDRNLLVFISVHRRLLDEVGVYVLTGVTHVIHFVRTCQCITSRPLSAPARRNLDVIGM